MARKSKNIKIRHKVYSFIVDGKCERWYLQLLKQHEQLPRIKIIPELPTNKKLKEMYELVMEKIKEGYDKVIWILDFDTIIKEDHQKSKGKKGKIQELKEYLLRLNKHREVFHLIVNTPCLEYWYLLHFRKSSRFYTECNSVVKELKLEKILSDYEKSEKYYKNRNHDIYLKLKPYLKTAIQNAKYLGEFDINNSKTAKSEMYKVFEILNLVK